MSGVSINPTLTSAAALTSSAAAKNSPDAIRKAATQFEAMLLGQMLQSAREADGDDDEDGGSALKELGEQQFAQALANSGGIGIANMVVAGLTHENQRAHSNATGGESR